MSKELATRLVRMLGSEADTARALKVSRQAVNNWIRGVHGINPKLAIPIEKATNGKVTRFQVAPEVFGRAA